MWSEGWLQFHYGCQVPWSMITTKQKINKYVCVHKLYMKNKNKADSHVTISNNPYASCDFQVIFEMLHSHKCSWKP